MRVMALLAALFCGFQQPPAAPKGGEKKPAEEGVDRVVLLDRSEVRGEIVGYEAAGRLRLKEKESGRTLELPIEDVARLQFGAEERLRPAEGAEQVRLAYGGMVSGKVVSFDGATAVVETPAGTFRLRRADLKSFLLGPLSSTLPDLKDEGKDVLIREVDKKEEGREKPVKQAVAEYGRLLSLDKNVVFRVSLPLKEGEKPESRKEEVREFERASVKHVYFHREGGAADLPAGWFSKVTLKNGDRLVGVLQSFSRDKVRFFSHLFGTAEIEKQRIRSIAFVQNARMTIGNILVCDQSGVKELDRAGNELWTYAQGTQYAWIARKLENGNVLIANTQSNQILEVKPSGRSGGEVVWKIDNTQYPYDAVRLDNGNTLVAEYYSNKVVEYEPKTRTIVWQVAVTYPMSVQRLDNGNTLISTNVQVLEVDKEGRERWRPTLRDVRPWRAQRLENGNTLITDFQRGQVVEIDPQGNEVWRRQGLSHPVQAIRLEDGNTLILEQGNNRLIEVDPSVPGGIVNEIRRGISYPQGMSTY